MTELRAKLTKKIVDAATAGPNVAIHWDTDVPGFGLRVTAAGAKAFIVQYRIGVGRAAQSRRLTLGKTRILTCEEARQMARDYLARARIGTDPGADRAAKANTPTVADAIDIWAKGAAATNRRTGAARKKEDIRLDINRLNAHILPLIGKRPLGDLKKADIERARDAITAGETKTTEKTRKHGVRRVRGGSGTAARTLRTLGSVFAHAVDRGLMLQNPARGIRLQPSRQCERYLSEDEARRLGEVLGRWDREQIDTHAIAIIRLLALTGARRGEIMQLKWSEIDFERGFLVLSDTKKGRSIRPMSGAALALLSSLPRTSPKWVFPSTRHDGFYVGLPKVWSAVRKEAGLTDFRLHDLRHSFASFGAASGLSLPMIGMLLGHKQAATTQRYAHLGNDPARRAADQIADVVAAALGAGSKPVVAPPFGDTG